MSRSLRYLLDTDMCIYLLNGDAQVKARVAQEGIESLAVTTVTVGELYFGAYNSARIEANVARVDAFLSQPGPQILPVDEASAIRFGQFKAGLRRSGQLIGDVDIFIAGVAVHYGLTVVTNNTSHFARLAGLTLENWRLPAASSN